MASNGKPHFSTNIFQNQSNGVLSQTLDASVRQDKARISSARTGTPQPAAVQTPRRAKGLNRNTPRSTNRNSAKTTTVHLDLWVSPIVKAELQRIAEREGVSVSHAGAALLEQALQQ